MYQDTYECTIPIEKDIEAISEYNRKVRTRRMVLFKFKTQITVEVISNRVNMTNMVHINPERYLPQKEMRFMTLKYSSFNVCK